MDPLSAARDRHSAVFGVRAHGLDGLLDELVQRDPLHRPPDLSGLEAGELEQVVHQVRERRDMGGHLTPVARGRLVVGDPVFDGLGQQPQRRQRSSEVMRDGGDQVAPGRVRRVALRLAGRQAVRHPLGRSGQPRQLVVGPGGDLEVACTLADRGHTRAHGLDVAHHPGGQDGCRVRRQAAGEHQQHGHGQRVVCRHEHEQRDGADPQGHQPQAERQAGGELPRQGAEGPAPGGQRMRAGHRGGAEPQHQAGGDQRVPRPVDQAEHQPPARATATSSPRPRTSPLTAGTCSRHPTRSATSAVPTDRSRPWPAAASHAP